MTQIHRFGSTYLAKVTNSTELKEILKDPWLKTETVIIKPNWVEYKYGLYTDADTLRMFLESIEGKIVVIEGHQLFRALKDGEKGLPFKFNDRTLDWDWIKQKGWNWQIRNPDWGWFRESEHWPHLQRLDERFLNENGFTDLFKEFDVEFINVTDEIWSGKTADPKTIKEIVEAKYPPLFNEALYGYIPSKLFQLRGSTLISLNKLKQYGTFSMKNMFGLIPDPIRAWWHGKNNKLKPTSITAVNQLYDSLFNVYGIIEALQNTPITSENGVFNVPGFKYDLHKDLGIVAFGRDRIELDTIMWRLGGYPESALQDIIEAEKTYGKCDANLVRQVYDDLADWLPKRN
ncbi:DUF362 domain-containing protein [Candidatus Bathyarchaeota archaeon]|nr:DUF362 domain-containing protein [Candidatus Bathyarchaeota archaeon]